MNHKPLPKSFYHGSVLELAKSLLGKTLVRNLDGEIVSGKIVETEAYHETGDPSCHAHRGKTKRNSVMFGPPAHLYVYFTYGMHHCLNVVAEPENTAAAVLIRAVEPLQGSDMMKKFRGEKFKINEYCNGPAKLCQAFGITTQENGISLLEKTIFISEGEKIPPNQIVISTRIGISQGQDLPWRFFIKNNPFVSRK